MFKTHQQKRKKTTHEKTHAFFDSILDAIPFEQAVCHSEQIEIMRVGIFCRFL